MIKTCLKNSKESIAKEGVFIEQWFSAREDFFPPKGIFGHI